MFDSRSFYMPAIIHFGNNASSKAGYEAKRINSRKTLVVTDSALLQTGTVQPVLDSLSASDVDVVVYDQVVTEPTLTNVEEGLRMLRTGKCDLIVGVGGGSCLDTAKAISIMSTNPGIFGDYRGFDKFPSPGVPLIAVPTTAGTGSEVTAFCVITDTERNIKMSIGSPYLIPTIALVDPLLTMGLPKRLTAATGMDALTHAIEAYVSVKAQPMTDLMALSAMELLGEFLPRAWSNPEDLEARTKTLMGSLQAGVAFSNASVGLVHGMARPLGAFFHVPHGLGNAALLSVVMGFCIQGNPERYARIARAIGADTTGLSPVAAAQAGTEKVKELVLALEVPTLQGLGVDQEKLKQTAGEMAEDAIASGAAANSPRVAKPEEIVALYFAAY
jgi:alcohol dehydrogenase class IV